jgi:predicted molibdopterin-dependent oxidoreductase YjgC
MASDGEGFLEPDIDEAICVKCGLCVKVCPVLNNRPQNKVAKVYAAANKDENVCAAGAKMLRPHETQSNIEICKKM